MGSLEDSFSLNDAIEVEKMGSKVLSLYQFNKVKVPESHLFAQLNSGRVIKATNQPPAVTSGIFGSAVFNGTSGQLPASWANVKDKLIFANGVDAFQIYSGTGNKIRQLVVFRGSAAPGAIPEEGEDFSNAILNGEAIVLDSLGDLATDYDCVFIRTDLPCNAFTWTVSKPNGSAAVAALKYWNGSWTAVDSFVDNTADSGKTLAVNGTMTWTLPTDSQPLYMFGGTGFWNQLYLSSGALDSEVEISALTFEADWQAMINMWDGVSLDAVEAQFYGASAGTFKTYGGSSIDLNAMTSSDALYFNSANRSLAAYFDFGDTPNTTGSLTIAVKYWDGSAWQAVADSTDGTAGFTKSGWITWTLSAGEQPRQFNASRYYSYWYQITVSDTLSATVNVGIVTIPYYDIALFGKGLCCCAWKNRLLLVFDSAPADITVSALDEPLQLSSATGSAVLKAGDGRQNPIKAMRPFYNEVLVAQQELGEEGGCITLFEGYTPATFGKLVLSHHVGTLSNKTFDVAEGVQLTDARVGTVGATLSVYGVFLIDGKSVIPIHEKIKNYFDPQRAECIRKGYENEMWLKWDTSCNVLRIGLVSGSSATEPNVFPVFDPIEKEWYFDNLTPALTCMAEAKADSGNVPVLQLGGAGDGFVYQLNTGLNDVAEDGSPAAIDAFAMPEFDGDGSEIALREFIVRVKAQTGNLKITAYNNGILASQEKSLTMVALRISETSRRHKEKFGGVKSHHFSLKFQNDEVDASITLLDYAVDIEELTGP